MARVVPIELQDSERESLRAIIQEEPGLARARSGGDDLVAGSRRERRSGGGTTGTVPRSGADSTAQMAEIWTGELAGSAPLRGTEQAGGRTTPAVGRCEAEGYRIDRQQGQDSRLVVWCDAQGMTQQLETVADPYSVPVYSSGGFDSLTVKHMVAQEFAEMGWVKVLHIGDHDPSGVHVYGSLDEDVRAFIRELGGEAEFERLALACPAWAKTCNLKRGCRKE